MKVQATIEIPRGDNRRRHLNKYNKSEFVDLGPMKDHIPVNDGVAPEHYGFIPDTHNPHDGDEVDVIIFSERVAKVGEIIDVRPIALLKRSDNDEKVVAVEIESAVKAWEDLDETRRSLVLAFYGSHHQITSVEDQKTAEQYIHASRVE
ncbi:MAG: inorganic diphosphatase [bacterium]|nr:inorganic diphosphatase [bacterium]